MQPAHASTCGHVRAPMVTLCVPPGPLSGFWRIHIKPRSPCVRCTKHLGLCKPVLSGTCSPPILWVWMHPCTQLSMLSPLTFPGPASHRCSQGCQMTGPAYSACRHITPLTLVLPGGTARVYGSCGQLRASTISRDGPDRPHPHSPAWHGVCGGQHQQLHGRPGTGVFMTVV